MGKKGNDSPPAPDYTGMANQQAALSAQNTAAQTSQNRPDVYTPYGSQTWSQDPNDPNRWTQRTQLSPQQQQALDSQMGVQATRQQGAQGLANQAVQNTQNPIDYSGAPAQAGNVSGGQMQNTAGGWREKAQQSVWDLQQPGLDRSRSASETAMANQGITRGSEAWNAEQQNIGDNEARARLLGVQAGQNEANMLFNQDLAGTQQNLQSQINAGTFNNQNRQQYITEEQQRRAQPINEMNALQSGQQVNMPQMPSYTNSQRADAPNLLTAANMGYQANLDGTNASNAGASNMMGGLFSLGGAALSNPNLFSWGG